MASSKEIQQSSRPLAHRPSLSNTSSALSTRQSHSRTSSHSLLVGSGPATLNNRISRRKSMNNGATNVAAVAAALSQDGETSSPLPITGRRQASKSLSSKSALVGSLPSPPASLPASRFMRDIKTEITENPVFDDGSGEDAEPNAVDRARVRRASDGQPLTREGRRSNRVEIRCETCGKGYKHSSCLSKHLWEHTPEWKITSKFLISKHQQVQLLEAASVLVAMNNKPNDIATPPDSAREATSDGESPSPAASGYSDQRDLHSSADTTPPPQLEVFGSGISAGRHGQKRHSSGSGFSRSYQSSILSGLAGSAPNGHGFGHMRHQSHDLRPVSSGRNATGPEDHELAAAIGTLSCSYSSSSGRAMGIPADAPPVPPLPAQYLGQAASFTAAPLFGNFPGKQPESFTRGRHANEDVQMGDGSRVGRSKPSDDEDDDDMQLRARSDEDDDFVIGRMQI